MPFNPRLVPSDDEFCGDDEQLAALGEQLREDAAFLANTYPAGGKSEQFPIAVVTQLPGRDPRRIAQVAVAALLVVAGLSLAVWQGGRIAEQMAGQTATPEATIVPAEGLIVAEPSEPSFGPLPPPLQSIVRPVSHQSLTGPEWEAVLDLLESDQGQAQSISL